MTVGNVLRVLDGEAADGWSAAVFAVYDQVFGDMRPYDRWRRDMFDRHRAREEYRLALAVDGDDLLGFAWAYVGRRGQYWSDLVAERLPTVAGGWIDGHLELVELAVQPAVRGRGLGGRLLEAVLRDWGGVVLVGTDAAEGTAPRLYRRHGFVSLGLLDAGTQVMGRPTPR